MHKVFPIAVANGTCGRRESSAELAHAQDRAHHTMCHDLAPLHDARMPQTHLDHACFYHLYSTFCRPILFGLYDCTPVISIPVTARSPTGSGVSPRDLLRPQCVTLHVRENPTPPPQPQELGSGLLPLFSLSRLLLYHLSFK